MKKNNTKAKVVTIDVKDFNNVKTEPTEFAKIVTITHEIVKVNIFKRIANWFKKLFK